MLGSGSMASVPLKVGAPVCARLCVRAAPCVCVCVVCRARLFAFENRSPHTQTLQLCTGNTHTKPAHPTRNGLQHNTIPQRKVLHWAFTDDVKMQDCMYPLMSVAASGKEGQHLAWAFFKENFASMWPRGARRFCSSMGSPHIFALPENAHFAHERNRSSAHTSPQKLLVQFPNPWKGGLPAGFSSRFRGALPLVSSSAILGKGARIHHIHTMHARATPKPHTAIKQALANAHSSLLEHVIEACAGGFYSAPMADDITDFFKEHTLPSSQRKISQVRRCRCTPAHPPLSCPRIGRRMFAWLPNLLWVRSHEAVVCGKCER